MYWDRIGAKSKFKSKISQLPFLRIFGGFTILSADEMKILRSPGVSEVVQKIHK